MRGFAKIFFMLCVMFVALSCVDAVEGLDVSEGEICMSPVLSEMTKTRAGGDTNPYPDGSSFGAFAYYNQTQPYFKNHKFTSEDGVCAGDDPVYWPLSGSLIFAGYSPFDEGIHAGFDVGTKTLTISDYVVDGTKDLMYFLPELDEGDFVSYDKSAGSVDVEFHHALSCVSFNVFAGSGGGEVKLTQICLGARSCSGDFSVEVGGSGVWGNRGSDRELIVWEAENADGLTLSPSTPLYAKAFVIPGNASSITVSYKIGDESKSKSFSPEDTWYIGKNNIYNISIDSQEAVIISPSVSFSHKYSDDGVLVGSQVNVDLGFTDKNLDKLANISNLNIEVKAGSESYKTYSAATISSNEISFDTGNRLYLPNKDYTVVFTYNDGLEEREVSVTNVYRDPPDFDLDVKVLTRPYRSLDKPAQIVGRRVSLTISDDVLAEVSADVLVQTDSSPNYDIFDIKSLTVSSYVNYTMTPITVSNGTVSATAQVIFGGDTKKFDKSFYVASSYTRSQNPINNASELEDGCKYTIGLKSSYYWAGGSSLQSQTIAPSGYGNNLDYIFIFLKDDDKKAGISSQYKHFSAGAWVLSYDWTYLQDSFDFESTPSYFTCASHYDSTSSSNNQKIYIFHEKSPLDMLRRDSSYEWGYKTSYDYSTWYIYKLEEN